MPALPTLATPLPTLMLQTTIAWEWPLPPYARLHAMAALPDGAEPCRIETPTGVVVEGQLEHFDAQAGILRVRVGTAAQPLTLPFARFRRLTLTTPWTLKRRAPDAPGERVPTAAQERDYRIDLASGGHLSGRTMGHVQDAHGLFLYAPHDDGAAALRVFVPHAACAAVTYGKSAEETAAERWIATPEQLLAALDNQKNAPIKPLGQALLDLGFITHGTLNRVINEQGPERERPLGEMLVAQGLLERADLQTALAHKMGYPLVDLMRFPLDAQAVRKLTQRTMIEHSVMPLMQAGERLIVAVDDLARIARLQSLEALAQLQVVPVLASRGRIALALAALPQRLGTDRWADNVSVHQQTLRTQRATGEG